MHTYTCVCERERYGEREKERPTYSQCSRGMYWQRGLSGKRVRTLSISTLERKETTNITFSGSFLSLGKHSYCYYSETASLLSCKSLHHLLSTHPKVLKCFGSKNISIHARSQAGSSNASLGTKPAPISSGLYNGSVWGFCFVGELLDRRGGA